MSSPYCQQSGVFSKFVYLFQFQFVNSFLSLFYIAFYLQDMEKLKEVIVLSLLFHRAFSYIY